MGIQKNTFAGKHLFLIITFHTYSLALAVCSFIPFPNDYIQVLIGITSDHTGHRGNSVYIKYVFLPPSKLRCRCRPIVCYGAANQAPATERSGDKSSSARSHGTQSQWHSDW